MTAEEIKQLLGDVKNGRVSEDEAISILQDIPFKSLDGFANLDTHRSLRCGFPEVVFGEGKTANQLKRIITTLAQKSNKVLVTRLSKIMYDEIKSEIPDAVYHSDSRLLVIDNSPDDEKIPGCLVLTAGTIDIPVAEEAAITMELMGNQVDRIYDVGVAGLPRLLAHLDTIRKARVIVVVAGMDGALPSVVGGLVSVPVIGVPTSTGYGASFNGVAALLTMINSCASGVAVVNIDNGFGAGSLASRINHVGCDK